MVVETGMLRFAIAGLILAVSPRAESNRPARGDAPGRAGTPTHAAITNTAASARTPAAIAVEMFFSWRVIGCLRHQARLPPCLRQLP